MCVGLPFDVSEETLLLGRLLNRPGPAQQGWVGSPLVMPSLSVMAGLCTDTMAHSLLVNLTPRKYNESCDMKNTFERWSLYLFGLF